MYVLGISAFAHESSCSLIKDGRILAIVEEERFNREKHTWKFPVNAIQYCLRVRNLKFDDIDEIAFFWNPYKEVYGNAGHFLRYFPKSLNLLRKMDASVNELSFCNHVVNMARIGHHLQKEFQLPRKPKVHFIEHHLCHAASAFHVSPFEEAAIFTIDGGGESTGTRFAQGKGTEITKLKEIRVPHSIGHLYAAITDYLGFRAFFDEWKVMGMSAYGRDTYLQEFEEIVQIEPSGTYKLNLDYFEFHIKGRAKWLSNRFLDIFGPRREGGADYTQHHYDIAFALQRTVEKVGVHLAHQLYKMTGLKNLCITGGVALNCLMNKKIIEQAPFEKVFIQPIANDAGTSLGAALYRYHHELKKPRNHLFNSVYWGPEFSNEEIELNLRNRNLKFKKCENIARDTAQAIAKGKIVGWFQGRMEAGPRALGNRSITVDPTDPKMKDRLNARVKKREAFRPFAPSVLEEKAGEFFDLPNDNLSPYMILVGDVKKGKREVIPAVTHQDNTARVHTVSREVNPKYWALISEFEKIRGVPVLLNTSFNENEPIVCTPDHAIDCFLRTEFDVLAIGDYLVTKGEA